MFKIETISIVDRPCVEGDDFKLHSLLVKLDLRLTELQSKKNSNVDFLGRSEIVAIYKSYKRLIHLNLKCDSSMLSDYKRLYMMINRTLILDF